VANGLKDILEGYAGRRQSNRLAGFEPLLTAGSAVASEVPALTVGLVALDDPEDKFKPFSGAVEQADEVREMLTYNPRSMEGQAGMQSLLNSVSQLADTLGLDTAFKYLNEEIIPRVQSTLGEDAARELGSMAMMIPAVRRVTKGIDAFHGSPYDFDEFSMDAIGTGEGAQAYGHGLYFADSEKIAKGYRDKLTPPYGKNYNYDEKLQELYDKTFDDSYINTGNPEGVNYLRQGLLRDAMNYYTPDEIRQRADEIEVPSRDEIGLRKGYVDELLNEKNQIYAFADELESLMPPGRVYKVKIDADPDELLDWDKPLSEQTDFVRERMQNLGFEDNKKAVGEFDNALLNVLFKDSDALLPKQPIDLKGDQLYYRSAYDSTNPADASEALKQQGIKGIRYKDGFSRGKDGGSYNYVIFDDRLISISKKYGIAIPAAAVLLGQETGQDPSSLYEEDFSA
tara:strand:+ start:572 stop:1936 length:1365 start_codon:yes stop_codon:yes gene_type:complete